ncbi:MAG: DUF4062 domain-containing protein [Bacteroidota bacterium]
MSFSARVFKVFIASPSDVANERRVVRQVLNRWNEINAEKYGIILHPVGWETHSSPEIGDHPQKLINENVLEDCDLLIGVFWTRFGTPTEDYDSGTEEEIEEHIKTGKPTMLYFSNQPVAPENLDQEQFEKVQNFKEKYQDRGLYEEYSSIEDFQKKLSEHIQIKINNDPIFDVEEALTIENLESPTQKISESLSEEAKKLLQEAANDPHGNILNVSSLDGKTIQANGINLNSENTPRSRAKWENALEELEQLELVKSANYKREVFKVTQLGFEVADSL